MPIREIVLAKPNYSFEKRQRDLEKKRKQEEKRLRKLAEKKPAEGGRDESVADLPAAEAAELFQKVFSGNADAQQKVLFQAQMLTEMAQMSLEDELVM